MNIEIQSALLGGAAGAIISTVAQLIISVLHDKAEDRRSLRELATTLGIKEFEQAKDATLRNGGGVVYPPEMWVSSSYLFLKKLKKLGRVSPKEVVEECVKAVESLGEYCQDVTDKHKGLGSPKNDSMN